MSKVMKQFSIYLPNKPGELKKLLHKVKKINLSAAATFASKDGAIMRLVPQDTGSFQKIMNQNNINYSKQDVLLLTVKDDPGGLLRILAKLQQAHINIDGLYIVGESVGSGATCIIQTGDVKRAQKTLG